MLRSLIKTLLENRHLWLILIIGTFLRLILITENPPSLNWDEVSHGYNAYSILKSGKDEWGEFFPTIFRAYGDYKLPVYIYITAVSEFFLGINEFAVRLPSILAGVGTIIFTYFLVLEFFSKNKNESQVIGHNSLATFSALQVAIESWSLFLSRGAFEANMALFLFVGGMYFFLKGLRTPKFLILNSLFFGLTIWTYNSYRIFTPLMILALSCIYGRRMIEFFKSSKKLTTYYLLLTTIFFIPMFWQLLNPIGQARYGNVAILDEGVIAKINEARANSSFSPIVSRVIYNKGTYFVQRFSQNYFSHFSPRFLFFEGGSHFQFSVPNHGLLYLLNIPFLLIGLLFLFKGVLEKQRNYSLILVWLLIAPIPSSLTREAPHVLRAITFLPIPMIITSFGFQFFLMFLKAKYRLVTTMIYIIVALLFLENYLIKFFVNYKKDYSWSWQYGYKEVVEYVKKNYNKYDKIIVTKKYGEAHEFFLYYWPWDPEKYRSDPNLIRFYQSNWYWVDGFDKFYFVNDWEVKDREREFILESKNHVDCMNSRCLLVTSPNNYPFGWKKLETINFLDGKPAFEFLEN